MHVFVVSQCLAKQPRLPRPQPRLTPPSMAIMVSLGVVELMPSHRTPRERPVPSLKGRRITRVVGRRGGQTARRSTVRHRGGKWGARCVLPCCGVKALGLLRASLSWSVHVLSCSCLKHVIPRNVFSVIRTRMRSRSSDSGSQWSITVAVTKLGDNDRGRAVECSP